MNKKLLLIPLAILIIASLVACAAPEPAPAPAPATTAPAPAGPTYQYQWRMSSCLPSETEQVKACQDLAAKVKERTDGRIDITVYGDALLGTWAETNESLIKGDQEMMCEALDDSWDPRIAIGYYMPFIYIDYDAQRELCQPGGIVYNLLNSVTAGINYRVLGYFAAGVGGVSLTRVPDSPFDPDVAKGIKTRVMALTACRLTYERMGYMVAAIPFGEVYTAIQTGIVDGQQGGGTMQAWGFKDVNSVWLHYKDYIEPNWYAIGEDAWQSLDPIDQEILTDTTQEVQNIQLDYVKEMDAKYMGMLEDYGWTVLIPTDAEWETMAAAVRKDVWPELVPLIGKDMLYQLCDHLGVPRF